jgi:DNA-binding response OmpR family regulator
VDDDPLFLDELSSVLMASGYVVICASDAASAFSVMDSGSGLDLILVDLDLPDKSGLELIHVAAHRDWQAKIMATSGKFSGLHLEIACYMGATVAIPKFTQLIGEPFPGEQWVSAIRQAIGQSAATA